MMPEGLWRDDGGRLSALSDAEIEVLRDIGVKMTRVPHELCATASKLSAMGYCRKLIPSHYELADKGVRALQRRGIEVLR